MGDMAEGFNAMQAAKKERKEERLARAITDGWTKHTQHHFSMKCGVSRIDWWPSTAKMMIDGKMFYGMAAIQHAIRKNCDPELVLYGPPAHSKPEEPHPNEPQASSEPANQQPVLTTVPTHATTIGEAPEGEKLPWED